MRIISFNIGVEIGQIVALLAMIFLISGWRKTQSFSKFSIVANAGLIIAGFLLFIMQIHGFLHTKNPDDFGFSKDNHYHAHEEINSTLKRTRINQINLLKTQPQKNTTHNHGNGGHSH